ncbi:MAG TPA: VWA domain-containing protein [Thermoanaerobaculia bacterium]|nr:VWA domain-containing protein [Thermoanaerobaculia bacterium]
MARRARALALTLLAVPLCIHPLAASAQEPAPPQSPPGEIFADSIDVNAVNLEVVVTGRDGERVTGLTRDDFEVYEDGRPVEVTYFHATAGPARPADEIPAPERLQLAVYFDLEDLPEKSRPGLAGAVEDFLVSRAGPEEKVLLASYNGADTLNVRELPASRPALAAALREIVETPRLSPATQQERQFTALSTQMIGSLGGSNALDLAMIEEEKAVARFDDKGREMRAQMRQRSSLAALEGFVASLGGQPGRKALLYVSGSIAFRPGQSLAEAFETKLGRGIAKPDAEGPQPFYFLVQGLQEVAASERIAFYALGTRHSAAPNITSRANTPSAPLVIDRSREITEANPAASLAWIGEDLSSYYALGYTREKGQPGRRHRVEVKVKRPGLHARHIESYVERSPEDRMRSRASAALHQLQRDGGENPLGVSLRMGQAVPEGKKQVIVPLTLEVPLSGITLLPGEGGARHGQLSIFVTARDGKGRTAAVAQTDLPLRLDGPLPPGISYDFQLALRPGPHEIVLGVWDELGNTLSTLVSRYDPAVQ